MSLSLLGLEDLYKNNAIPTLVLSLGLLGIIGILLTLGRRLDSAMKLERFGIPIALLVGALGFLIGPYGPFSLLLWILLYPRSFMACPSGNGIRF